jgi:NitT/TauT family transport system substrate-binding protein
MDRFRRMLGAVALCAAIGCGSAHAAEPAKGVVVANGETVRVQLIAGVMLSLPLYVAVDKGFFANHGLKAELVALATGPLGLQALAGGSIEFAGTGTEVIMNAYARQADVQLVAGFVKTNTFTIEANKDLALPHLKDGYPAVMQDLKDVVFGVSALGSSGHLYGKGLFADANIDPASVKFLAVGSSVTAYPALVQGKIGAYMATEPMQTLCKVQKSCVPVLDLRKGEGAQEIAATNGASLTFAAMRPYIKANPVVVDAFIQAITDSQAWIRDPANFDALTAVAKRHLNLSSFPDPDAMLIPMLNDNLEYFGATVSPEAIVNMSRYLVKNGQIPNEIDPAKFVYAGAPKP